MKCRLIAYGFIFAASVAVGYLSVKPVSAATNVTVTFGTTPVHYGYHPPVRYYGPVPRYYPRGYFAPRHYYGPRNPGAYMRWHHRGWDRNWDRYRHGFQGKGSHWDHDRHDRHRRDHDRHHRDRHDGDRRH